MYYKKRAIFLVLTLSLGMTLVGCSKNSSNTDANGKKENIVTGSSIETKPESINNNDANYTIKTKSIVTNNIHVNYPQIVGLKNVEIQNKWNTIIKEKVDSGINNIGNKDTYVLSYKVKTQNENMISILMIGETATASTDYESYVFKYTYNIDLETGGSVRLKDSVDTEKVADDFMKGTRYSVKGVDDSVFREYLNLFYKDKEDLCKDLNSYDFGENMEFVRGYSYFESGKVYLCINVNHNLGDYIEVMIDN